MAFGKLNSEHWIWKSRAETRGGFREKRKEPAGRQTPRSPDISKLPPFTFRQIRKNRLASPLSTHSSVRKLLEAFCGAKAQNDL